MTNELYTLMETNRDRSIIKRSARCKKSGSKSKKCTLGHEYMTKKELEKMNGECKSWKLTKFYTWEEFKEMPDDIKVEYINYLVDTYGIGLTAISLELFNCCQKTLSVYLTRHNLLNQIRERKAGGNRKANKKVFKELIAKERKLEEATEEIKEVETKQDETPKSEPKTNIIKFSAEYISNGIDYDMLFGIEDALRGKKLKVSISVEAV